MKILRQLVIILLFGLLTNFLIAQTVVQVAAGDSTLEAAFKDAAAGDIIELATDGGLYTNSTLDVDKDITIRAADGLVVKPKLENIDAGTSNYLFFMGSTATLNLEGLDLNGDGTGDGAEAILKYIFRIETGDSLTAVKVKANDCLIHDVSDKLFKPYGQSGIDTVLFTNSTFYNSGKEGVVLYSGSSSDPPVYMNYAEFYNCTFYGSTREAIKVDTYTEVSVLINHCTFYDNGAGSKGMIYVDDATDVTIKNSIFQNCQFVDNFIRLESDANSVSNCLIWDVASNDVDNSASVTDTLHADPLFADAGNADFTLGDGSPAFNFADDGMAAGDLRWAQTAPPVSYLLTINVEGNGVVATTPDTNVFAPEETVVLTATADDGWEFIEWSGDLTGSENPDTLTMSGHKTVTAVFKQLGIIPFTIAEVKYDGNYDFVPDMLGDTVMVLGTVTTPNFAGTSDTDYGMQDATGGINLSNYTYRALNIGDSVSVIGVVSQYKGKTEIVPLSIDSIKVISSGHDFDVQNVNLVSIGESTESELMKIRVVWLVDAGEWPGSGNDANVLITDGVDTTIMHIDKDTDLDENPAPDTWFSITGIGDQYSSSVPANDGYRIKPRFYSDIITLRQPGKVFVAEGQDALDSVMDYVALPNDTIILTTDGGDYPNSSYLVVDFPLTVMAAPGFAVKPKVYHNNPATSTILLFEIKTGGSLTLRGLDLDGLASSSTPAKYLLRTDNDPMSKSYNLKVYDSYLHDVVYGSDGNFFRAYSGTFADTVIFDNCIFSNSGKEGVRIKDEENMVKFVSFNNCTFYNTNKEAIYIWGANPVGRVNHCTFDACGYNGARSLRFRNVLDAQIKNIVVTNNAGDADANRAISLFGTSSIDYSDFYNAGAVEVVGSATIGSNMLYVDPLYKDASGADFTLDNGSPVLAMADDGHAMGDLRWDPTYSAIDNENIIPEQFNLSQNYPNPFNPSTTIKFILAKTNHTILTIYNLMGQKVAVLLDKPMQAGAHEFSFRADNLASGIYFYRIESGNYSAVKKMVLLK